MIAPNKSLGAQLANEFREVFPDNAVEYFVTYYDYYQPEAYVPQTDTYIEKDSSVNDEIERLRHSATAALLTRRDVLIVASVSCIYGLGSPEEYEGQILRVHKGADDPARVRDAAARRHPVPAQPGEPRARQVPRPGRRARGLPAVRGDRRPDRVVGRQIERITRFDPLTGEVLGELHRDHGLPGHPLRRVRRADEARGRARSRRSCTSAWPSSRDQGKLLEAERLRMRTAYDLEMLREVGFCSGIENYSRHIDGRGPGEAPYTLLDYFPEDCLCVIDESHVTVPQIHGMYEGDLSRKATLVEYGFRLPSALDNRPLRFEEFAETRGPGRLHVGDARPLRAPRLEARRRADRAPDRLDRPRGPGPPDQGPGRRPDRGDPQAGRAGQRVLVTTLTKKMAEDLTDYLLEMGIRVRYLHSEIDTLQRIEILRDLRLGEFDVLVGINLLREGLDLPEVSLVAILDADKEGFLRSETSLIQTIGRAARNVDGTVIMYADQVTDSMKPAIAETQRRRKIQMAVQPRARHRPADDPQEGLGHPAHDGGDTARPPTPEKRRRKREHPEMPTEELERLIQQLEEEMHEAAKDLRFEYAARIRDEVVDLRKELKALRAGGGRGRDALDPGPARVVRAGPARRARPVVCEGGRITFAGPRRPIGGADEEIEVDGFLMPAVADRHVHIRLADPGRSSSAASPPSATSPGRPNGSSRSPTRRSCRASTAR